MPSLSSKQKLGVSFALYVFFFLAFLATLFFFIFRAVLLYQVKRDMSDEINEVISDHITFKDTTLVFEGDGSGNDLREELLRTGISGLFLDKDLNLIKGFGIFSLYQTEDKAQVVSILDLSKKSSIDLQIEQATLRWQNQNIFAYFVPLISEGQLLGIAILGRPLTEMETVSRILVLLFSFFGLLAVFASFAMGYLLSAKSFSPIAKFSKVLDDIDLDKLDRTVPVSGHPDDELYVLGMRFNEMLLRLKTMSQQQKEFISNVSHELKTPITRAVSTLEVISPSDPDYLQEVSDLKSDLLDINNLLDKLLFLSRLRKELVKNDESINLKGLLVFIKDKLSSDLIEKSISLNLDIKDGVYLWMPREYSEVLFTNIISNSLKYSKPNTVITIKSVKLANSLVVSITDQGIGMTEDELTKIFDRFYRANDGKKLSEGSGIGLSIVKRLCDLYEIDLRINSKKNEGTTFVLEFKS